MIPEVFVVILNYNGENDTIECIESIIATKYKCLTLCVIDNGSSAKSVFAIKQFLNWQKYFDKILNLKSSDFGKVLLKKQSKNLIFIENEDNLGFAAGNNIGIKIAISNGFDHVLLLNNDTIVERDFIDKMANFTYHHSQYIAATPKICLANPKNEIWNCGGRLTWYKNRKYYFAGKNIDKTPASGHSDITFITGCALWFKPKETGILTERFFHGEEDFEFSLRIKRMKRKMACVNNAVIYHKVGSTINKASSKTEGKAKVFYVNRFIDLKSNFPKTWKWYFFINGFYGFLLMSYKYKINFCENIKFWSDIYQIAKTKDRVTKEDFMNWTGNTVNI
jgi:GT2 family glycosyltransferase